jgi:hypothetical protein
MRLSTTIPATVEIRRSRLIGLIACVAAVAAVIAWAVSAYVVRDTGQPSVSTAVASAPALTWQERYYVQMMTTVCSVVMCQPDDRLAARLGFRTRR